MISHGLCKDLPCLRDAKGNISITIMIPGKGGMKMQEKEPNSFTD